MFRNQEFQKTPLKMKDSGNIRPTTSYPRRQIEEQDENNKSMIKKSVYSQSFGVARIKPKNIIHDKEKLYEQAIHLKTNFNKQIQENHVLKVKVLNLTKENQKYEKIIEEMQQLQEKQIQESQFNNTDQTVFQKKQENNIVLNYKKQLKEKQKEIDMKHQEIQQLRKNIKITKINELEKENQLYNEECSRLRNLIEQTQNYKKDHQSENHEDILKEENIQLASIVKLMENDKQKQNGKIKEISKNMIKLRQENGQLKKQIDFLEEQRKLGYLDKNSLQFKQELQKYKENIESLNDIIRQKDNDILVLQQFNSQLKRDLQMQKELQQEQQKRYTEQLQNQSNNINIMSSKYENEKKNLFKMQEKQNQLYQLLGFNEQSIFQLLESETSTLDKQNQIQKMLEQNGQSVMTMIKKRQPSVKSLQVQKIGLQIRYRLIGLQIPICEMRDYLFDEEALVQGEASINDMMKLLQRYPFSLKKNEDLVLLCRYLVEDNQDPFVQVDMDKTQDLYRIRSILQTVISDYQLLKEDEQLEIYNHISMVFNKYKEAIINNLQFLRKERKGEDRNVQDGLALIREVRETFNYIGAEFTQRELEYFLQKMYQRTQQIETIEINYMFQYFDGNSFKEENEQSIQEVNIEKAKDEIIDDNHLDSVNQQEKIQVQTVESKIEEDQNEVEKQSTSQQAIENTKRISNQNSQQNNHLNSQQNSVQNISQDVNNSQVNISKSVQQDRVENVSNIKSDKESQDKQQNVQSSSHSQQQDIQSSSQHQQQQDIQNSSHSQQQQDVQNSSQSKQE